MIFLVFEGKQKITIRLHFPKTLPCVCLNPYALFKKCDRLLSDSFTFAVSHQTESGELLEPLPMNQEVAFPSSHNLERLKLQCKIIRMLGIWPGAFVIRTLGSMTETNKTAHDPCNEQNSEPDATKTGTGTNSTKYLKKNYH